METASSKSSPQGKQKSSRRAKSARIWQCSFSVRLMSTKLSRQTSFKHCWTHFSTTEFQLWKTSGSASKRSLMMRPNDKCLRAAPVISCLTTSASQRMRRQSSIKNMESLCNRWWYRYLCFLRKTPWGYLSKTSSLRKTHTESIIEFSTLKLFSSLDWVCLTSFSQGSDLN